MNNTRFERNLALACLAVVVLVTLCIRLRLLGVPFERDEGEYAYFGQLILRGIAPFKLAYNMKLPGTGIFYAAAMAVFGQTIEGARVGLLVANSLTIILLFCLGMKLLGQIGGLASSIAYADRVAQQLDRIRQESSTQCHAAQQKRRGQSDWDLEQEPDDRALRHRSNALHDGWRSNASSYRCAVVIGPLPFALNMSPAGKANSGFANSHRCYYLGFLSARERFGSLAHHFVQAVR